TPYQNASSTYNNEPVTSGKLQIKLFGIIPIKTSKVEIYPDTRLYVGGQAIGVALYMKGVLVIGSNEVMTNNGPINPAKDAGIKTGDIIVAINGINVADAYQLVKYIDKSEGREVKLTVDRRGKLTDIYIKPACDSTSNKYKLGIWVRDSTAGVGTLTFVDPATRRFGALGHPIIDCDTGITFSVREGEIFDCQIIGIQKGEKGKPGELKGLFGSSSAQVGIIDTNCEYGLFGMATSIKKNSIYPQPMPIGKSGSVQLGPATILCNISGTQIKEYSIVIEDINRLAPGGLKGMVIRVTDKELLEKTNGIVQGMSGSPIIQNGRIIGAVTHVFISDPTKGYGLFIDKMIENIK
ncbi:MAG TPA: SpoIVB peptidase, partial [Clostridia bacterium]|nr:SpoIVB peptidase [Clostridia bacterium]